MQTEAETGGKQLPPGSRGGKSRDGFPQSLQRGPSPSGILTSDSWPL